MSSGAAQAETPVDGGGLPPLPDASRVDQLRQESAELRAEARELGGGRTIKDSIRKTEGRIADRRQMAQRFEEVAEGLGASIEDLKALQAETEATAPSAGGTPGQKTGRKVAEQAAKRALSTGLRRFFRIIGFAADAGEEALLARYKNMTKESFTQLVKSSQLNLRDVDQLLTAVYRDLGFELGTLKRLQEIDRRDSEIFRELTGIRGETQGAGLPDGEPNMGRGDDAEYDGLLNEFDRLRFQLKLAQAEGRRVDAEILRGEIEKIQSELEELEDLRGPIGCGAGFFYIPGTDTCLNIGGQATYSWIENPSTLGGGTVVRGGLDSFSSRLPDEIKRFGGGLNFEYGLGKGSSSGFDLLSWTGGSLFLFGGLDYAEGSANSSSSAEVGVDGVTNVGLTFADFDGVFGTGFGSGAPGVGIRGSQSIDNQWLRGELGLGFTRLIGDSRSPSSALVFRAGLYAEGLDFDASGSTELLFDGAPFGFYQDFDYKSSDRYLGVDLSVNYLWFPTPNLQISLGAGVQPAYHKGEGDYRLETESPGNPVVLENYSYDDSGFTVGAELSAALDWRIMPNVTLGTGVSVSWLPDVTAFKAAGSPNDQPAGFYDEDVYRVFFDILRVRATF